MKVGTLVPTIQNATGMTLTKQDHPKQIYVRQCYSEIADAILEKLPVRSEYQLNPADTRLRFQVGGTPQIGKSQFANYLLNRIIRDRNKAYDTFIVQCHRTSDNDGNKETKDFCCLLEFDPEKCEERSKDEVFGVMRYLGKVETGHMDALLQHHMDTAITFLDGIQGIPGNFDKFGHVVIFASPSFLDSQSSSLSFGGTTRYMPLWTQDEMIHYKSLCVQDPFDDETVENMFRLFSGCIGLATSPIRDVLRRNLYVKAVNEHVDKCQQSHFSLLDKDNVRQAKMIKLVPTGNGESKVKEWLTESLLQQIEYKWTVNHIYQRWSSVENKEASNIQVGIWFEDIVAVSWLRKQELEVVVYENQADNTLGQENIQEVVPFVFKSPPFIVKYDSDNFGVAFNTLYRLSVGAPSVDFYYLERKGDTNYRLYFIQVTVAAQHSVQEKWVLTYMQMIQKRITSNDQIRDNITRNTANGKVREAAAVRASYSFAAVDAGKEPKVGLEHNGVEIWFLYLQPSKKVDFKGKVITWSSVTTRADPCKAIRDKVKTFYAVGPLKLPE